MIFEILFYIYFVIIYATVSFVLQYIYLGVLQFEGYSCKRLILSRLNTLKTNYFIYILFTLLFVFAIAFSEYFNVIVSCVFLLVQSVLLLIFYIRQVEQSGLVFTKRIGRLYVPILFFDLLIFFLITKYIDIKLLSIVFYCLVAIDFLIVLLSFFIVLPIEKLIGKHYVKMAKERLAENKTLIKIGITGSYGKTSVKEILSAILNEHYNVLSTPKSYNTPFGITKTINEGLSNSTEVFVCEMGAKKSGEILELCNLVDVNIGVITAVGKQHTETFGSVENIYKTKKELADYLQNKKCVFNLMNLYTIKMYMEYVGCGIGCFVINKNQKKSCRKIKKILKCVAFKDIKFFKILTSYPKKNNYYAKLIKMSENGSEFSVYNGDKKMGVVKTSLLGLHNVINIIMAIAMAVELNVPFAKIIKSIDNFKSIKARLEKFITNKGAIVINNGYNSNINSATSSLQVLNLFKDKIKVVITPGLVETSDDFTYNRLFGRLVSQVANEVIIVKEKNKDAIISGLSDNCFDMSKVYLVKSFSDARGVIDMAGDNYVFLIENDLPNYYK